MLFIFDLKNIEGKGPFQIKGFKVYYIVKTTFRYKVKYGLTKITVRINNTNTSTFPDIIYRHVGDESRFTRSCFPDDIYMFATICIFDTKDSIFITKLSLGKEVNGLFFFISCTVCNRQIFWRFSNQCFTP